MNFNLVSFDTVYEPLVEESSRVYVYEFLANQPKLDLVFVHGIGNRNISYLLWFGENFSKCGINTYFMILPYHWFRAPSSWRGGEPFFSTSPKHCSVMFHQSVKDVRRTLDYIEQFSQLPKAIMGFSFGGMITTMALAIDERFKKGILAFTGGDWRWINWYAPHTEQLRKDYMEKSNEYGCRDESTCVRNRSAAFEKLDQLESVEAIFRLEPACFHYDPISYAKFVRQPVLFFKGLFDRAIISRSSRELIKRLPDVRKISLPCGHRSSYFFRRFILRRSVKFLLEGELT
ncbi:MAG: alpha/beta hydrolase [Pseudothermotoga sp.]|nr:alpha/beta hydrolase [Pseudothermotoga sp.]HBT38995.1 alpha/beta hydrolase [Pseudothermotoga sp.]HCO97723.1 alpha/beta hydrolase [Pseudothermotoga sp.]